MTINRQFILNKRPVGLVNGETLKITEAPIPQIQEGEVLVRNLFLSIDPTNRIWMNEEASYLPPVKLGEVMRGIAYGRVEACQSPAFTQGDLVMGLTGWADELITQLSNQIKSINSLL